MKPEGGGVEPAAFRALLAQLLPGRSLAAVTLTKQPPRKG
jgi:hypothetical protein